MNLIPIYISSKDFAKFTTQINVNVFFGIGENNRKYLNREDVIRTLQKLVQLGDPAFQLKVVYGEKNFLGIFITKGDLFDIVLQPSQFLVDVEMPAQIENIFVQENAPTVVIAANAGDELATAPIIHSDTSFDLNVLNQQPIRPFILEDNINPSAPEIYDAPPLIPQDSKPSNDDLLGLSQYDSPPEYENL